MSLLTPDIGLLFWMLLSFGIVFFILAKFGFPIIVKMVEERKEFIETSLKSAKEANERLAGIKEESDRILALAREEQLRILKEAADMRAEMIKEGKAQASVEADKIIKEALAVIRKEKDDAIRDVRNEVIGLSVDIAEKLLRKNLEHKSAQMELASKLIDEAWIQAR
ncbi:MAG: F0F1 ATP synthase subunit B [Dysgonamonadaceae bacterium]|jgi:F-type H+-transporting ATPase subunit b|nr:F0F1 ATP synthase subunit B [Dysgonamonadaceae bacterium]